MNSLVVTFFALALLCGNFAAAQSTCAPWVSCVAPGAQNVNAFTSSTEIAGTSATITVKIMSRIDAIDPSNPYWCQFSKRDNKENSVAKRTPITISYVNSTFVFLSYCGGIQFQQTTLDLGTFNVTENTGVNVTTTFTKHVTFTNCYAELETAHFFSTVISSCNSQAVVTNAAYGIVTTNIYGPGADDVSYCYSCGKRDGTAPQSVPIAGNQSGASILFASGLVGLLALSMLA